MERADVVIVGAGPLGCFGARALSAYDLRIIVLEREEDVCNGISKASTAIIFRTGTTVLRLNRDQTALLSGSVGKGCIRAYQIPVIRRANIDEILGDGRISGGTVRHLDTGYTQLLVCDTMGTALGFPPEQELADPLRQARRLPDWLSLCGNCEYIHGIVDSVTTQAENLGASCGQGESI